jgi:hypothetical protein
VGFHRIGVDAIVERGLDSKPVEFIGDSFEGPLGTKVPANEEAASSLPPITLNT